MSEKAFSKGKKQNQEKRFNMAETIGEVIFVLVKGSSGKKSKNIMHGCNPSPPRL